MDASEQTAAAPAGRRFTSALLGFIAALPASFLFLLIVLALGTFLPPVRSLVNVFFSVLATTLLTVYFNRRLQDRSHWRVLGALALLGAVCVGLLSMVHGHWHDRAADLKRNLDFRLFPVSLVQFQEDLPDSQYAYPALAKTVEKDFDPAFYDKTPHADSAAGKWTPETARTEAALAAQYSPYLEKKLLPLLKRKYTRYMKADYRQIASDPLKAPSPRLGSIVSIARISRLSAVSLAREGKTEKAWALARLPFSLSDIFAGEKTLLEKMTALSLRGQGVDAAGGILLNRPGAVLPKEMVLYLRKASGGNLSGEGLKAELAFQYDMYEFIHGLNFRRFRELGGLSALAAGGSGSGGPGLAAEYLVFSAVRSLGLLDLNSIVAAGYFSDIAAPGSWAEVSAQNLAAEARVNSLPTWPFFLVKVSLPSFSRLQARELEVQARARLTLACAEVLRYRREHGKYPRKLSDLGSVELQPDPFTGAGLVYEQAAGGFNLCSAGAAGDLKDNSGKDLCLRQRP